MEILLLLCVSVSPVSHRQHTGDRTTDPFLCSVPGKENSIFIPICFPFVEAAWSALGVACGHWLPCRQERDHPAAVISGAQRSGFITLSRGLEPFQLTTLQFVSHVTA